MWFYSMAVSAKWVDVACSWIRMHGEYLSKHMHAHEYGFLNLRIL
jgi:hypothetical protein